MVSNHHDVNARVRITVMRVRSLVRITFITNNSKVRATAIIISRTMVDNYQVIQIHGYDIHLGIHVQARICDSISMYMVGVIVMIFMCMVRVIVMISMSIAGIYIAWYPCAWLGYLSR